jgi:hypothetical protein
VCGLNLFYIGNSLAIPIFDTQTGLQFWLINAALHGAAVSARNRLSAAPPGGVSPLLRPT